jgi:arylsulfatase A-like enzyme
MKKRFWVLGGSLLILFGVIGAGLLLIPQSRSYLRSVYRTYLTDRRPNFLVIITDDQRYDTMQYMPETQAMIFDQGVTFDRAYVTTPLCCPSRVSIFTGDYAHNTGVWVNQDKNTMRTLMQDLHAHGYFTGLVGKYLNSWDGEKRPEIDFWVSYFGGESEYIDPSLNNNGYWQKHIGYITDILGTYSIEFVDAAVRSDRPWILVYTPIAPHYPTTPYPGDLDKYTNLAPYRPPSFNEADVSDKTLWTQQTPLLDDATINEIDKYRRDQILTLLPLDRAIVTLLSRLKTKGELDNTVVIFISDNGMFWGEHRQFNKDYYYEEAIKVPFAIRYPDLIPQPYHEDSIVANIDIAPTIYDLSGVKPSHAMDGLSLVDLIHGAGWREGVLIEGGEAEARYYAWVTEKYILGMKDGDRLELYDMVNDPYQLNSLAEDSAYSDLIAGFLQQITLNSGKP